MKLSVGIPGEGGFFQQLLNTLGIHCTALAESGDAQQLAAYPVIIAPGEAARRHASALVAYVQCGGHLLIESESTRQIKAFAALPLQSQQSLHAFSDTLVSDELITGILQAGHCSFGRGSVLLLPRGYRQLLQQQHVRRKRFPTTCPGNYPTERVATMNRAAQLRLLEQGIKLLFQQSNLPYAHLWPFPGRARGVAGFRIDTDFADAAQLRDLQQLCRDTGISASWFVEAASARVHMSFFAEMPDQETGYHCYRHQLPFNSQALGRDLQHGLRIMSMAGLHPRGYAAPYGEWRSFLPGLLHQFGFTYSSEFALAYDALPFNAIGGAGKSRLLQIPIHPISCGRLAHAGISEAAAVDYYRAVVRRNRQHRLPAFLYHHPAQKGSEVFRELFSGLKADADMVILSMGEYAAWWRKRAALDWSAEWHDNQLELCSSSTDQETSLCLEHPDGRVELHDCAGINPPQLLEADPAYRETADKPALGTYSGRMWRHDLLWHYRRWKQ